MSATNKEVKDAAEALVAVLKAVSGEVKSANNQQQESVNATTEILQSTVDTLNEATKTSNVVLGNKLDIMNNNLGALRITNEKINARFDALNQQIVSIDKHLEAQTTLLLAKQKRESLTYLMDLHTKDNGHYFRNLISSIKFDYRINGIPPVGFDDLTRMTNEIVQKFFCGLEYNIPLNYDCGSEKPDYSYGMYGKIIIKEEDRVLFRSNLMRFLEQLLGHKPCLVHKGDGKYAISF